MIEIFKKLCKKEGWSEFLHSIELFVKRERLRERESIISISPYRDGIQVVVRGEDEEYTNKNTTLSPQENPEPYTVTRYPVRTIHIWWAELESEFNNKRYEEVR